LKTRVWRFSLVRRGKYFCYKLESQSPLRAFQLRPDQVEPAKEEAMSKASLAVAIVATILACPAYAADLCNDAHMKQMDQMIAQMTDTAKQKEATAALDQSKAAMKNGDTTGCMKHMAEAHKAMGL
jgi:hypothetical protein